jgi:predicted LPLAT superfamily acyltransferase
VKKEPLTPNDAHWSAQQEQAAGYWHVKLMLIFFRLLPPVFVRLAAFPVGFCYFLFSKAAREHSRLYLQRIAVAGAMAAGGDGTENQSVKKSSSLAHILSFALALVEKVEAWGGKVSFKRIQFQDDDIGGLIARLEKGEGAFLISSHLGNMEFIRALAGFNRTGVSREIPVNAVVDVAVTAHFNRMLHELNPRSVTRLINARDMGPQTIITLQERLAAGELVVIAGDRTSPNAASRSLSLEFLGGQAAFPYGPFFLAALIHVPVYAVFALRQKDVSLSSRYTLHIHQSPVSFDCPRAERGRRIEELACWFAALLERYCKERPAQWYNFYDFWHEGNTEERCKKR